MKFQDSSFNGLKVTVGTKSVTHAPTHARSKSNMHHQLFQSWGHNEAYTEIGLDSQLKCYQSGILWKTVTDFCHGFP